MNCMHYHYLTYDGEAQNIWLLHLIVCHRGVAASGGLSPYEPFGGKPTTVM
jgi:hypothetical protein